MSLSPNRFKNGVYFRSQQAPEWRPSKRTSFTRRNGVVGNLELASVRDATAGSLHALASVLEPLSWLGCCFKVCATSGDAEQKPPEVRSGVKVEVVVLGFPPIVPNSPYGLCGRKAQSSGAV